MAAPVVKNLNISIHSQQHLKIRAVSLSNAIPDAGQPHGWLLFPEATLQTTGQVTGFVEGVVDSRSVVEICQSGVLIYTTILPAGPFKVDGFRLLDTRTELDVTLIGDDGTKRQFIVKSPAFLSLARGDDSF
ncbi:MULTISPECIES: fimbria/pilus outer membrane usher protein [unclassified Enterobacter cloacae complex]|nr:MULTISPECIES: fimbria/pilus outer membrane usher protein [unclassified Enterobacter cloacae complex]MBE4810071.1 fimbria/pilus outer membrane usher protein [Enterobacter cloacae complex sp. P44RS]MBE4839848.1 fimbria/pilus outer membrane usher protein [Enterobacter cloacae complex sp. P42C]